MDENKKLKDALDEQINRELKLIPSEKIIREQHVFSEAFLLFMQQLMDKQSRKKRNPIWYSILKVAAFFLIILAGGTLLFTRLPLGMGSNNKSAQLESCDEAKEEENQVTEESVEEEQSNAFSVVSLSYDGEYHIEVCINNATDSEMTYTPIYKWSYTKDGESIEKVMDIDFEKSKKKLKEGGYITEHYDLRDYGIKESGGILTITRRINGEETCIDFKLEA